MFNRKLSDFTYLKRKELNFAMEANNILKQIQVFINIREWIDADDKDDILERTTLYDLSSKDIWKPLFGKYQFKYRGVFLPVYLDNHGNIEFSNISRINSHRSKRLRDSSIEQWMLESRADRYRAYYKVYEKNEKFHYFVFYMDANKENNG